MKKMLLPVIFTLFISLSSAQSPDWKPAGEKIMTAWAAQVDPTSPLPEYPRPQMRRDSWVNLNGLWDYAIRPKGATDVSSYDGEILVPFAVESALSGVARRVGKDSVLLYRRTVTLPRAFRNQNVLLHFGAVDWKCDVWVNGTRIGSHSGGYDPFYFDITPAIKGSGAQEISVSVWDPSDEGPQPRGKQVKSPRGIWYTPVTGIWQTVWLESVPQTFVESLTLTPDPDRERVMVHAAVNGIRTGDRVKVSVWDGEQKIAEQEASSPDLSISIPGARPWSPESPFLYDVRIGVLRKGKVVDEVRSYFGMRKISIKKDAQGNKRLALNNEILFQYGPLDQGWWPDGLYTAPTDAALVFDIQKTKDLGFNMIRKHVKVEPARWYYHCDRLGMLVWQDMPSGDMGNRWDSRPGIIGVGRERERTAESESIFRREWKAIIDANRNAPSIVVWVPFNEAWGQFKTEEIVEWTMSYDPTRLVNGASGGNFTAAGHIMDLHNYPDPAMPSPDVFGREQAIVLGEYGGLGLPIEGHTWQNKNNWGYQTFTGQDELLKKYEDFIGRLPSLIRKGLAAAVYTQTTDVEIETNGLMTYDRKVIKFPEERLRQIHDKLYEPALISR